jgi:hypothetical protein
MSKKDFKGGLDSLLGSPDLKVKTAGRPKKSQRVVDKSSQEGTKVGETRATFIVREDLLDKIKGIAYWDRVLIKDLINGALQEFIDRYEKKTGEIKQIPTGGGK